MTGRVTFVADDKDSGRRADAVVAAHVEGLSRSAAGRLFQEGQVLVNGEPSKPSRHLSRGDRIEVTGADLPPLSATPQSIPLTVVYEDEDLAVIDKPAGLVVHPAPGHAEGTLANALAARYPHAVGVGTSYRPGIVHRLDKDTSGLMVVALTGSALRALQRQLAARTAGRRYLALAAGKVHPDSGVLDAPIGRHPRDRKRMAVYGLAQRPARTAYRVLRSFDSFTYLEASLETGRTHQIRVHLAASGHPLAGDVAYGGPSLPGLDRQFLHAHRLTIHSPSTGRLLEFSSALPPDLAEVLRRLEQSLRI